MAVVSPFVLDGHINVNVRNSASGELPEAELLDKTILIVVNNTIKETAEMLSIQFVQNDENEMGRFGSETSLAGATA